MITSDRSDVDIILLFSLPNLRNPFIIDEFDTFVIFHHFERHFDILANVSNEDEEKVSDDSDKNNKIIIAESKTKTKTTKNHARMDRLGRVAVGVDGETKNDAKTYRRFAFGRREIIKPSIN